MGSPLSKDFSDFLEVLPLEQKCSKRTSEWNVILSCDLKLVLPPPPLQFWYTGEGVGGGVGDGGVGDGGLGDGGVGAEGSSTLRTKVFRALVPISPPANLAWLLRAITCLISVLRTFCIPKNGM